MTAIIAVASGGSYVDMPTPAYMGYSSVPNEVNKAGTNTAGVLYKDRIRIRNTISLKWNAITPADKNLALSLTSANDFNCRYFDCETSTFKYGKFYRGNDLAITPILQYDGTDFGAYNITMSLVEFRCIRHPRVIWMRSGHRRARWIFTSRSGRAWTRPARMM